MVCVFTPAGVMVAWKVLPTPESVYNVVDFTRWFKVGELITLCSRVECGDVFLVNGGPRVTLTPTLLIREEVVACVGASSIKSTRIG